MKNRNNYVIIDCGDVGARGRGGHGHNDLLSVEVTLEGDDLIVDRGSDLYTASPVRRIESISSRSHNAAIIDRSESAPIKDYDIPKPGRTDYRVVEWSCTAEVDTFEGESFAWRHLGIIYRRRIKFLKQRGRVEIIDQFDGNGMHKVAVRFYLAPEVNVAKVFRNECIVASPSGHQYRFSCDGDGEWRLQLVNVFPRYGVEAKSTLLIWESQSRLPLQLRFVLTPE